MKHLTGTAILYHVTPADNIPGILIDGICPKYHTGKMYASWYLSRSNIQWGITHVAVKHHEYIDDLVVCMITTDWQYFRATNRRGFYWTDVIIMPESVTPATFFLDADGNEE